MTLGGAKVRPPAGCKSSGMWSGHLEGFQSPGKAEMVGGGGRRQKRKKGQSLVPRVLLGHQGRGAVGLLGRERQSLVSVC
jgi:hypothetical protein